MLYSDVSMSSLFYYFHCDYKLIQMKYKNEYLCYWHRLYVVQGNDELGHLSILTLYTKDHLGKFSTKDDECIFFQ